jgi:hypothetical protein
MPYSYAVYTGNGATTQFTVPFPYIRREHVFASLDYVSAVFTWVNNTTVQISPAPANGVRVEVRRVTPVNNPLVDFTDGSTLVAADLDTNALQQTYINQEQDDQFQDAIFTNAQGLLDAGGQRITNVGNPTSAQDAATKTYVDTLASQPLVNFNINTLSSSGGTGGGSATFNGTAYRFTLSHPPAVAQQLIVSINGVVQKPNSGTTQPAEGFAIDQSDIIFSQAPAAAAPFFIVTIGNKVDIGTPSDGTVTTAKIADGAVTIAKLSTGGPSWTSGGALSAASLNPTGSSVPTNGLYLPAANTLAASTAGAEALRVTSDAYLRMASGTGGIQFNGDTAAANALNDYEEGTWTPTVIGTTTAGTASYSVQVGRYTKIGRMVNIECHLTWSSGTGTGNLRISGLPFTAATFTGLAVGTASGLAYTATETLGAYTNQSSATVALVENVDSGNAQEIPYDAAAADFIFSGCYSI